MKLIKNKLYDFYEKLPEMLMPYTFTRPMIKVIKKVMGKTDLVGVEIGVYLGENVERMFKFLSIKKLYLIDPYISYRTTYGQFNYGDVEFKKVRRNLAKFGERVVFIRKISENAVDDIPDNLDFVYVDGNHDYEYVKRDIILYFPKIKQGGIIGGHDFNASFVGVCKAVLEFVNENELKLCGFNADWWILK